MDPYTNTLSEPSKKKIRIEIIEDKEIIPTDEDINNLIKEITELRVKTAEINNRLDIIIEKTQVVIDNQLYRY